MNKDETINTTRTTIIKNRPGHTSLNAVSLLNIPLHYYLQIKKEKPRKQIAPLVVTQLCTQTKQEVIKHYLGMQGECVNGAYPNGTYLSNILKKQKNTDKKIKIVNVDITAGSCPPSSARQSLFKNAPGIFVPHASSGYPVTLRAAG